MSPVVPHLVGWDWQRLGTGQNPEQTEISSYHPNVSPFEI